MTELIARLFLELLLMATSIDTPVDVAIIVSIDTSQLIELVHYIT